MWSFANTSEKEPLLKNETKQNYQSYHGTFISVPNPIVSEIASYLDYKDMSSLAQANKRMLSIVEATKPNNSDNTFAEIRTVLNKNRPKIQKINDIKKATSHKILYSKDGRGILYFLAANTVSTVGTSVAGYFLGPKGGLDEAIGGMIGLGVGGAFSIGLTLFCIKKARKQNEEVKKLQSELTSVSIKK